jgi:hypothetical protein
MKKPRRLRAWIIPALLILIRPPLGAQRLPIDAISQYRLYLKVLSFDRAFKARAGDRFVIGILYVKALPESRRAKDEFAAAVADGPAEFEGLPVSSVPIEYGKEATIEADLAREAVDVLYVTSLSPFGTDPVAQACRARRVATFTGLPEYVEQGVSVSFEMRGRGAQVVINLKNSLAEGSDFDARLLNMVKVVGGRTEEGPREAP